MSEIRCQKIPSESNLWSRIIIKKFLIGLIFFCFSIQILTISDTSKRSALTRSLQKIELNVHPPHNILSNFQRITSHEIKPKSQKGPGHVSPKFGPIVFPVKLIRPSSSIGKTNLIVFPRRMKNPRKNLDIL